MTARPPIATPHRDKLRDARRQLERVADAERRFVEESPFRLVHRYDPRAGVYTVRVDVERELPEEVPGLVTGVLRDVGAALDALVSALAPPGNAPKALRFPIFDSLPQFAQRSRKSLAPLPPEAQATIEELQPYHTFGGFRNDVLWLLRELSAEATPRLAGGSVADGTTLGVNTQRHVEVTGELAAAPGAFESGDAIASIAALVTGPDPKLDLFLRPSWELAFARSGPARGAPVGSTLAAICEYVEQVVFARLEPRGSA